ncbi:MAG: recombination regulator RecX [Betaproteobacteria bacterium]
MSQSPKPKRSPSREKPSVSLRAQALRLLARREHTRLELQRKLAAHTEDASELDNLLDEFTARGWLAEARVAEQVIHTRRGRFGSRRIRQELLAKGVAEEIVASVLPQLKDSELEAARSVWRRKFKAPPSSSTERARQVRFMLGRGFAMETILEVIRSSGTDDEDA